MENASKALIMAGSVLLSLLIITTLVFMFGKLGDLKNSEASTEEVKKLAEYNRQIETFDRALYGSELLSLANLIDDYNKRQADLKGYNAIVLQVYSKGISSPICMQDNYTRDDSYKDLISDFETLQKKLNEAKNKKGCDALTPRPFISFWTDWTHSRLHGAPDAFPYRDGTWYPAAHFAFCSSSANLVVHAVLLRLKKSSCALPSAV